MSCDNLDQSLMNGKFPFECDWLDCMEAKFYILEATVSEGKDNIQNFVRFLEFLSLNFDRLKKIINFKQ